MNNLRKVYQIRQGKFSDGNTIFNRFLDIPNNKPFKIYGLSQAPAGHPAWQHNTVLKKTKNL